MIGELPLVRSTGVFFFHRYILSQAKLAVEDVLKTMFYIKPGEVYRWSLLTLVEMTVIVSYRYHDPC